MNNTLPLLVGITGGIGAGKTTIAKFFSILGIPLYYADDRAKWLMANDTALKTSIITHFGDQAYTDAGELNRTFIAASVFADPDKTAALNALVHPTVKDDFTTWVSEQQAAYVLKEAALLYETGSYRDLDKVILVAAPLEIRISRVMARDPHRTKTQIHEIIARQLPEEDKKKLADFVVENKGNKLVIPQLLKIHDQLLKLASNPTTPPI